MYTIFDMNHFGVKASLQELVPLVRKHGIGGIQVPVDLMGNEAAAREASKLMADNGLKWSLLPTPADFYSEDVSEAAFDKAIETLKSWAAIGEKMGVRYSYNHIWNGSNSRDHAANFEWLTVRIRRVWRVLNESGIRYGMEFLGPCPLRNSFRHPFFNTLSGALALADAVDPSCGFVFDTYHWYTGSDANVADAYLASRHVDRMVNFHVNDGIPGRTREEQQDLERALPLETGVIDAALPYRLFKENGYTGPVMCEPMRPWSTNPGNKSVEEVVRIVAETYKKLDLAAAGH